jgi:glutamine cyclotransferase
MIQRSWKNKIAGSSLLKLPGIVSAILTISLILLTMRENRLNASSIPKLPPLMTYSVVNRYPHDPKAFTQGLIYRDGFLYESTGLYGKSSLRKVELTTGKVLQNRSIPPEYFSEGLTEWKHKLLQLTWREKTAFIYAMDTFDLIGKFAYPTEGWGLTNDGASLILSDGTYTLYFLDPNSFRVIRRISVNDHGVRISQLNELEYIRGEIFANIWQTDRIIRIDPATGNVLGWIDLAGLYPEKDRTPSADVMNGIAYDDQGDRIFITGKQWPFLYEIKLALSPRSN